jgi:membrane protein involved in colicin uptake
MSEGQSRCSVTSSVQHRQEAEVAAAEERERAAAETAATAASAATLAMAELAAARAEVEAATAAELKALRASSTGSSVSADDDRDNELKLSREAAREQTAAHPRGAVAAVLTSADAPAALQAGARATAVSPMAAAAQTGADVSAAGLTEIAAFTGGVALHPRTGTMVTMGSRSLSGTSVPASGGLPSPRPTTSSGPR